MQFNLISLGAFALLTSSALAQGGVYLGGKRAAASEAADCKRSFSNVPDTRLQTTAISPQPSAGAGVGGLGGKNGTTPIIVAGGSTQSTGTSGSSPATASKSAGGLNEAQWAMSGLLAAAGVVAML